MSDSAVVDDPEGPPVPLDTVIAQSCSVTCLTEADREELSRWSAAAAAEGFFLLEDTNPFTGVAEKIARHSDGTEFITVGRHDSAEPFALSVQRVGEHWETRGPGKRVVGTTPSLREALEAICATAPAAKGAKGRP